MEVDFCIHLVGVQKSCWWFRNSIPSHRLDGAKTLQKKWDKLPTSTGDRQISEPSTVWMVHPLFLPLHCQPAADLKADSDGMPSCAHHLGSSRNASNMHTSWVLFTNIYIYITYYIYCHTVMILYHEYITYYIYTVWVLFLWFRIQTIHVIFDHKRYKSLLGSFSITHQSSKEKKFSSNGVLSPEWFSPLLNFQHSTWGKTQV